MKNFYWIWLMILLLFSGTIYADSAASSSTKDSSELKVFSSPDMVIYVKTADLNKVFQQYKENNCFKINLIENFPSEKGYKAFVNYIKNEISNDSSYTVTGDENNIRYMIDEVEFDLNNKQTTILKEILISDDEEQIAWHNINEVHSLTEKDDPLMFEIVPKMISYFESIKNSQ